MYIYIYIYIFVVGLPEGPFQVHEQPSSQHGKAEAYPINRIATITTINRIATITTIHRIATITTINRIVITSSKPRRTTAWTGTY